MTFDLSAELIAALRSSSGKEAIADAVRVVVADEIKAALAARAEKLEPLADILGVKLDTAQKRLARDPQLRALGTLVGRRVMFKRSTVEAYFSAAKGVAR